MHLELASIALLVSGVAYAEPPSEAARAEALFDEGRRALDKEDYAAACALFARYAAGLMFWPGRNTFSGS